MSKTKEMYFELFANYDYLDMPTEDFEVEYRMWQIKEDRLDKMMIILDKLENKKEEELWLN